jgi:hypothetical protein
MKLKKHLNIYFIVFCLALSFPTKAFTNVASVSKTTLIAIGEEPSEHAKALLLRLFEIKNMDKVGLSNTEKKALRKELRGMKKEMKAADGLDSRIYITVGALILILLLILILR